MLDFKEKYNDLFSPSAKQISEVPKLKFLLIDGKGGPNGKDFRTAFEALYSISYTIKFWTEKYPATPGFIDFAVAPLEGLWSVDGEDQGSRNYSTP